MPLKKTTTWSVWLLKKSLSREDVALGSVKDLSKGEMLEIYSGGFKNCFNVTPSWVKVCNCVGGFERLKSHIIHGNHSVYYYICIDMNACHFLMGFSLIGQIYQRHSWVLLRKNKNASMLCFFEKLRTLYDWDVAPIQDASATWKFSSWVSSWDPLFF